MGRDREEVRVAGLFPGVGSEHAEMLKGIGGMSIVGDVFGRIDRISGLDIFASALGGPSLEKPLNAQLAVFGTSVCYWHILGGRYSFSALAGHSLGYYSALYASGSLHIDECVRVIIEAARAIEDVAGSIEGAMAAVIGLKTDECERICSEVGDVFVANVNSATQTVLSGRREAVKDALALALERGALSVRELPINRPLHSPLMAGIRDRLMPYVNGLEVKEPLIPVFGHTGGGFLNRDAVADVLAGQLERKVLWKDVVLGIGAGSDKGDGADKFLEIGPSDVLSKLVRWINRDAEALRAEEVALLA